MPHQRSRWVSPAGRVTMRRWRGTIRRTAKLLRPRRLLGAALLAPLAITGRSAVAPVGLHAGVDLPAVAVSPAWSMHADDHLIFAPVPALVLPAEPVRTFPKSEAPDATFSAAAMALDVPSPTGARLDTVELSLWPDDAPMLAAMPLPPLSRGPAEKLALPPDHLIAHPQLGDPDEGGAATADSFIASADLLLPVSPLSPTTGVPIVDATPPSGALDLPEPGLLLPLTVGAAMAALTRNRPARWRRRARPARSARSAVAR